MFQTSDARGDIVTTIAPSLEAAIATTRLSGTLRYTPALRLYATYSSQNGVDQVGDGRLLAALVPGLFYVDMRGSASVLPSFARATSRAAGRSSPGATPCKPTLRRSRPFWCTVSAARRRCRLGYSFQYSSQNYADFSQSSPDLASTALAANLHRRIAALRWCAAARISAGLALQARVDGTKYVGNGIYDDAHHFVTALEARYAILRSVAVLGEIGYENQEYSGTNPFSISDAIWSVGLRLTPRPDSIVIIRYGRPKRLQFLSS